MQQSTVLQGFAKKVHALLDLAVDWLSFAIGLIKYPKQSVLVLCTLFSQSPQIILNKKYDLQK
jgi:hypothetical protein